MANFDQATLDMAHEWVAENRPHLDGDEFDAAVIEAAKDIVEAEAAEDERALGLQREWTRR